MLKVKTKLGFEHQRATARRATVGVLAVVTARIVHTTRYGLDQAATTARLKAGPTSGF
jgi:hypothetical protein